MKVAIKTLGCKSNRYESDKLLDGLQELGCEVIELNEGATSFRSRFQDKPDLLVINTCTVTHIADRKSRQAVRSYKNAYPELKVFVFGCGSNVAPEDYEKMEEVTAIAEDTDAVLKLIAEEIDNDTSCEYEGADLTQGKRTRAMVKIQDGCNSYCSYCIIPRARGPEYSFPSKQILEDVKKKEAAGFKEIVLTGINIGEWKEDDKELGDLFEYLIENTEAMRFRVSSIEPKNFSQKLFKLFKGGRLCPHMHMSLQSGSDSVLKRMRRHYATDLFEEVCKKFREVVPDMGLTTDVIVGFPGETDEEFEETCRFVQEVGFLKLHVFPYSKRKNTVAFHMDGHIDEAVKKVRAKKLREVSDQMGMAFIESQLGGTFDVLVEEINDDIGRGYTPNYIPVQFSCSKGVKVNHFVPVELKSCEGGIVFGETKKAAN